MLDWGDLRYFIELARCGNLSQAARHLRVDHSTVARRIGALEAAVGVRLFDRMPRGYVLTADGKRMVGFADGVETGILALERAMQGRTGDLEGVVRISAPPVFASHFITPRLADLRESYPAIRLSLIGEAGAANLVRREADIAIRLSRPQDASLVARKIGVLGYGLYGATFYVAQRSGDDWDYLGYDESLQDVPQQQWIARLADGQPFAFCANDLASLHQAVRSGLGVAALPHFLGSADPDLVHLNIDASAAMREIWMVVHPDLRRSARIRIVMDALVAMTRSLREGQVQSST